MDLYFAVPLGNYGKLYQQIFFIITFLKMLTILSTITWLFKMFTTQRYTDLDT